MPLVDHKPKPKYRRRKVPLEMVIYPALAAFMVILWSFLLRTDTARNMQLVYPEYRAAIEDADEYDRIRMLQVRNALAAHLEDSHKMSETKALAEANRLLDFGGDDIQAIINFLTKDEE